MSHWTIKRRVVSDTYVILQGNFLYTNALALVHRAWGQRPLYRIYVYVRSETPSRSNSNDFASTTYSRSWYIASWTQRMWGKTAHLLPLLWASRDIQNSFYSWSENNAVYNYTTTRTHQLYKTSSTLIFQYPPRLPTFLRSGASMTCPLSWSTKLCPNCCRERKAGWPSREVPSSCRGSLPCCTTRNTPWLGPTPARDTDIHSLHQ